MLSISPCGTRALGVSPDARLSLYHTQDAERSPQTFSERAHLSCAYTSAPSWSPAEGSGSLVALGTAKGSVVVWDVARGEVVARLGGPEAAAAPSPAPEGGSGSKGKRRPREGGAGFSAPVRGLWWKAGGGEDAGAGQQLLACAEGSGWVHGWELGADGRAAGAEASKGAGLPPATAWRTGEKSGVTRVAAVAAEEGALVLAAAAGTIAALSSTDGKRSSALAALAGHALPVTALAVSSDEVRAVICARVGSPQGH